MKNAIFRLQLADTVFAFFPCLAKASGNLTCTSLCLPTANGQHSCGLSLPFTGGRSLPHSECQSFRGELLDTTDGFFCCCCSFVCFCFVLFIIIFLTVVPDFSYQQPMGHPLSTWLRSTWAYIPGSHNSITIGDFPWQTSSPRALHR